MAKNRTNKRKGKSGEAPSQSPAAPLNDDELQALAEQHKDFYVIALAAKKKSDAEFKNVCKRAKAELGKDAIGAIKVMIECDTPEGEAGVLGRLQMTVRASRWAGATIGTQFAMFAKEEMGGDRHFEEGKRAAMRGEPCKAPDHLATEAAQKYLSGWHAGNDARNAALAGKGESDGDQPDGEGNGRFGRPGSPLRETIAEGDAHIRETAAKLGTEPATHHVVG